MGYESGYSYTPRTPTLLTLKPSAVTEVFSSPVERKDQQLEAAVEHEKIDAALSALSSA